MLDEYLIVYCSPVLASLKSAGLFCIPSSDPEGLREEIRNLNRRLNPSGIFAMILREKDGRALIYVFRRSHLLSILTDCEVCAFLKQYGYCQEACSPLCWLAHLKERLSCCSTDSFPHEIGIFLGYPLEDVKDFVVNNGRNCKACGDWKVYSDVEAAEKAFEKNRLCTHLYEKLYAKGLDISSLAIAG